MMELQKRIDILDLWDEMPYSLDIKDFGNIVIMNMIFKILVSNHVLLKQMEL